jgi:hypothetical protein
MIRASRLCVAPVAAAVGCIQPSYECKRVGGESRVHGGARSFGYGMLPVPVAM